jgi:hypothetical protein
MSEKGGEGLTSLQIQVKVDGVIVTQSSVNVGYPKGAMPTSGGRVNSYCCCLRYFFTEDFFEDFLSILYCALTSPGSSTGHSY